MKTIALERSVVTNTPYFEDRKKLCLKLLLELSSYEKLPWSKRERVKERLGPRTKKGKKKLLINNFLEPCYTTGRSLSDPEDSSCPTLFESCHGQSPRCGDWEPLLIPFWQTIYKLWKKHAQWGTLLLRRHLSTVSVRSNLSGIPKKLCTWKNTTPCGVVWPGHHRWTLPVRPEILPKYKNQKVFPF